jgi:hypothetical protein
MPCNGCIVFEQNGRNKLPAIDGEYEVVYVLQLPAPMAALYDAAIGASATTATVDSRVFDVHMRAAKGGLILARR